MGEIGDGSDEALTWGSYFRDAHARRADKGPPPVQESQVAEESVTSSPTHREGHN